METLKRFRHGTDIREASAKCKTQKTTNLSVVPGNSGAAFFYSYNTIHMNFRLTPNRRLTLTGLAILFIGVLLLWEHLNGGIITHYFLQDDNMPAISNWWGLLTIPLITYFLLYRIEKRQRQRNSEVLGANTLWLFIAGLFVGIMISVFFIYDSPVGDYPMLALFIVAIFVPLYYSEYLLGFILALVFTFGGVIPLIGAGILGFAYWLLYKSFRLLVRILKPQTNS